MTGGSTEATGTPRPAELPEGAGAASEAHDLPLEAGTAAEGDTVDGTRFAHASEAEMARILDFYAVRWEYEPTTFPILWNLDGAVVESFAPDFYLPDLDVYLEMTTLKQRLVRKKNRKLRRLRELYPDIRIKLFYARDFRAMMLKYGRLGLAHSLSGTLGQVVSDRAAIVPQSAVEIDDVLTGTAAAAAAAPTSGADAAAGVAKAGVASGTDEAASLEGAPIGAPARPPAPASARATPRSRPGRRRRRPRKPTESRAEREAGT